MKFLIFLTLGALSLSGCVSPLIKAAARGDKSELSKLLAAGADVNAASAGETPLVAAAGHGQNDTISLLIQKGANPNLQPDGGYAPLMAAIYFKHSDSAKLLVDSGADVTLEAVQAGRSFIPDISTFLNRHLGGQLLTQAQLQSAVKAVVAQQAHKPVSPSLVDTPSYHAPERPDDYAVVVGIEKYADPDLPEASFAEHDADAVRAHLVSLGIPPRNIRLLSGSRATKSELEAYLEQWLASSVKKDSRVFFYFSGHGAPAPDSREAYLVPFDGDPEYLADTSYPLKRLYAKLKRLEVARVVIALDACFSGAGGRSVLAGGTRPLVTKVDAWLLGGGHITAMSASQVDQVSGTLDSQGHGIFTYYLLKGLNGDAAQNGHVTLKSLFAYLEPKVDDEASNQNRHQTPQLMPDDAPDLKLR